MSKETVLEHNEETARSGEQQVVALHIGAEMYGVDIAIINTVLTPQPITEVPKTPKFVKGVMNLRGSILPVVDLRIRFGLPALTEEQMKSSRIVIVETNGILAGMIVDSVSEVLTLSTDTIQPPSSLVASKECEFIVGIARIPREVGKGEASEQLIQLLDVYKALTLSESDGEKLKKMHKAA